MLPIRTMLIGGGNASGRFSRTLNLTTSASLVNIRSMINALGYLGDRPVTLTINLPAGNTISGGIYFGAYPAFDHAIVMNIDGTINGAGGYGGVPWNSIGRSGLSGGDAINCQLPAVINLAATASINGGAGGGGSGGGSARTWGPIGEQEFQEIIGGEGGSGWPSYSPGVDNGGAGGAAAATAGANGGNGTASTTGTYPWTNYSGGSGGAPGHAIRYNGHAITLNNLGATIAGTVG